MIVLVPLFPRVIEVSGCLMIVADGPASAAEVGGSMSPAFVFVCVKVWCAWLCGRTVVWLCGRVVVWSCGRVVVWLYGRMVVCRDNLIHVLAYKAVQHFVKSKKTTNVSSATWSPNLAWFGGEDVPHGHAGVAHADSRALT